MILEVCWDGLWTLSFGLSQFHGHGSWRVCEVALIIYGGWRSPTRCAGDAEQLLAAQFCSRFPRKEAAKDLLPNAIAASTCQFSPPEKGPALEAPPACLCVAGEPVCKVPPGPLPCTLGTSVKEGLGLLDKHLRPFLVVRCIHTQQHTTGIPRVC
jgi:hypothetical protein